MELLARDFALFCRQPLSAQYATQFTQHVARTSENPRRRNRAFEHNGFERAHAMFRSPGFEQTRTITKPCFSDRAERCPRKSAITRQAMTKSHRTSQRETQKSPPKRAEHLVAGAGFEPTTSEQTERFAVLQGRNGILPVRTPYSGSKRITGYHAKARYITLIHTRIPTRFHRCLAAACRPEPTHSSCPYSSCG